MCKLVLWNLTFTNSLQLGFILVSILLLLDFVNFIGIESDVNTISQRIKTQKVLRKTTGKQDSEQTFKDLRKIFNNKNDEPKVWNSISELEWSSGIQWPVFIFQTLGRIGNCLSVFGTALALSNLYPNITIGIGQNVYLNLEKLLHEETLAKIFVFGDNFFNSNNKYRNFEIVHPGYIEGDYHSHIQKEMEASFGRVNSRNLYRVVRFEGYTDAMSFMNEVEFIRENMRLKNDLVDKAQKYLSIVKKQLNKTKNVTFIGFHIRRGDYVNFQKRYFGTSLPDSYFYVKVLNYYRENFRCPVFILCSEDTAHLQQNFVNETDVIIKENSTPEEDFAILASCNHSAMTVGSFGFWASFMAGGRVLFAKINNMQRQSFMDGVKDHPNFIPLEIS